jgi:phosphoserine phosphatase RsbU/P
MFVTLFYGVLDPASGTLTYANAGHNPPFLLRSANSDRVDQLHNTGMALGVVPEAAWREETVHLGSADTLVLYTDGAIDALSSDGESFGSERLLSTVRATLPANAPDAEDAILSAIHTFAAGAPRFDDVTLMVVSRT